MSNDFYKKYYEQLVGFHIHKVTFEDDGFGGDPFPILHIRNTEGDDLQLIVSCDEEGNGAGFLFIELAGSET